MEHLMHIHTQSELLEQVAMNIVAALGFVINPREIWGRLIAALRGDPRSAARAPAEQRAVGIEGAANG